MSNEYQILVNMLSPGQFQLLYNSVMERKRVDLADKASRMPPLSPYELALDSRIDSIKAYRNRIGCSLAEAKARCDIDRVRS